MPNTELLSLPSSPQKTYYTICVIQQVTLTKNSENLPWWHLFLLPHSLNPICHCVLSMLPTKYTSNCLLFFIFTIITGHHHLPGSLLPLSSSFSSEQPNRYFWNIKFDANPSVAAHCPQYNPKSSTYYIRLLPTFQPHFIPVFEHTKLFFTWKPIYYLSLFLECFSLHILSG